jgi:hypothetical protein
MGYLTREIIMKSVLTGSLFAIIVAFAASLILSTQQSEAHKANTGGGAVINKSEIGHNLVGKDFK